MILTFLTAAMPLSKAIAYSQRDGTFFTTPYPLVRRVTSQTREVENIYEFGEAIDEMGRRGAALLFGQLGRDLFDESRAGHAVESPHEWMCFDFDKVDKAPTIEGAIEAITDYLPVALHGTECIIQLSSSCVIPGATKLSCHVFMRLATPASSEHLKAFLTWCNFSNEKLRSQLDIAESGAALKFKLDRAVADPSRLIYIAPPRCTGFEPAVTDLLTHIEGRPLAHLPEFTPVDRMQLNAEINRLREQYGLDPRQFDTIKMRGQLCLRDTEPGKISDVRPSGNNYLRFNLNGGDSYGYYIDLKNPEIIGNFKGEPFLLTKDVDEGFYKQLIKATKSLPATPRGTESQEVLAFYATNRGSTLYIGTYDRATDELRVDRSSETAANAWLRQFGIPMRGALPHYDLTYDIGSDVRFEEGFPVINLYERTNLMKQFGQIERSKPLGKVMEALDNDCPVTMMFIRSITGDQRSCEGFINWLAFIFQNRVKTGTAWLLWGTEGSGKGKFLEHVCKPLFGQQSVGQVMFSNVDKQFNSLLEGKLLVNIDEAAMSRSRDKVESMSKLRNWVTEPTIVINEKGIAEREVPSFVNFIISSNDFKPLVINQGDRRFHVGTRQEKRLIPTANEFARLVQGEELALFAQHLGELIVDEVWVRTPEMTEQKTRLFESTHTLTDTVALAVLNGDSAFFFEARPSNIVLTSSSNAGLLPIKQYDDLLRAMANNTLTVLTPEDLYVLFHVIVNDTRIFPDNPTAQKQVFTRYGLVASEKDMHIDKRTNKKIHGVRAPRWKKPPDYLLEKINIETHGSTVVSIRK